MSSNTEIEELITIKSVDVYQLSFNRNEGEYDLISVIKDSPFRIFREIIVGNNKPNELSQRLALIKCKEWFYPLESGKSFVYRSRDKCVSFLFPDPSVPDSLSVVVINTQVVDDVKIILFENILRLYASLEDSPQEWKSIIDQLTNTTYTTPPEGVQPMQTEEPVPQEEGMAHKLAKNIVYGAEVINNGITYGTQVANNLVMKGAAHLKSNTNETQQQNINIDPRVISGLSGLRSATHTARAVTGYAVNTVAKGTNQLSQCLAPHVRRHSTKLISSVSGKNEGESGRICDNIMTVASGGLQGFATLYNGVTQNAKNLAQTVTNETVDVVNRKYGNDAGKATEEALYSAGNTALTVQNVYDLGPKAIAKKAALNTGKHVINSAKKDESQR